MRALYGAPEHRVLSDRTLHPTKGAFIKYFRKIFGILYRHPPAPVCIYSLVCSQNLAIFDPLPPWCGHHSSVASNNSVYVEGVEGYHSTLALPTDTHAMQSQALGKTHSILLCLSQNAGREEGGKEETEEAAWH